jgi:hypothetical protein
MTHEYLGLLAFDLALLAVGFALLRGLGLAARRLAGLAFLTAWAVYGISATLVLSLGLSLDWPVPVVLLALIAGGGVLLARSSRFPVRVKEVRATGRRSWIGVLFGGLLVAYLGALLIRSVPGEADTSWDAWAFWLPKAKSIYYFGGLDDGPGGFTKFANHDYPPLGPAFEATNYHFMGSTAGAPLQFQHWLIFAAFFAALAGLLIERVRPPILFPSLAALALMPRFGDFVGSSMSDQTLAMVIAVAGVCGALWLLEGRLAHAILFTIFVTAATLLKNEGLVYGLALAAVVAVIAARRGERRLALALLAVPVLSLVPWKLWLVAHGLSPSSQYYGASELTPGHVLASSHRLGTSITHLSYDLFSPDRWLLIVPLTLAAAVLAARRRPELTLLTLAFVALSMTGLFVIYWIGTIPLGWWLRTSGERVVMSIVVCCGALFPLLAAESLEEPRR